MKMPRSFEEIIEEMLNKAEDPAETLMQDPSQMQGTMNSLIPYPVPNRDMATNPQSYETMNPPPPRGPIDRIARGEKFDDTQTKAQDQRRERQFNEDVMFNSRIQEVNPDVQDMDEGIADRFPARPRNLPEAYNNLPTPPSPRSNMPQIDPNALVEQYMKGQDMQQGNTTMQELMNFYTQGGQET
jgi:hypothetical protein